LGPRKVGKTRRHESQIGCVTGLEVDMKNRLIALAAICLLMPGILLAQPAEKKTTVGVWEVKTVPAGHSLHC
jgi:hypothetical protein